MIRPSGGTPVEPHFSGPSGERPGAILSGDESGALSGRLARLFRILHQTQTSLYDPPPRTPSVVATGPGSTAQPPGSRGKRGTAHMKPCRQCSGLMVVDHFMNLSGASGHMWVRGWRCVHCGAWTNPFLRQRQMREGQWISMMLQVFVEGRDPRYPRPSR